MGLSKELQIGKAGEHLVCVDLILQGFNAFLADQGLPFDVLAEKDGIIKRIQVKTTSRLFSFRRKAFSTDIYRFSLRRSKGGKHRAREIDVDWFAFVALDINKVAYIPMKNMVARSGKTKVTMDFKSRDVEYKGRIYSTGKRRTPEWGKFFQDYQQFQIP